MTLDSVIGWLLPVCSCGGGALMTSALPRRRAVGFTLALFAQPMWLWVASKTGEPGVYFTVAWFTACWARGVYVSIIGARHGKGSEERHGTEV